MRTETVRFEPYKLIVSDSGRRTHRSSYDVRLIRFFFRVSKPLFHRTSFSESFPVRVGAFREVFSIFVVVYWIIVCVWGGGSEGKRWWFQYFRFRRDSIENNGRHLTWSRPINIGPFWAWTNFSNFLAIFRQFIQRFFRPFYQLIELHGFGRIEMHEIPTQGLS